MEYNELVGAFAAKCGLEQPDAKDGVVVFEIDGMPVGFIHDPAEAAVMVVAEIGEPNPDADEACSSALLKANYLFAGTGGATVAKDMKTWSEFKFGDQRLNKLSAKFVERQNSFIKEIFNKPNAFTGENQDVFTQLTGDAHRTSWNFNGKVFKSLKDTSTQDARRRDQEVMDEFLRTVTNSNARKAISILMNQAGLADIEILTRKTGFVLGDATATKMQTEDTQTIPGVDMFVSRGGMIGILADSSHSFGFEISKDGTTATVTVSIDKDITTNGMKFNKYKIGTATITQKTKIDLTKDTPEVVDVTFSQVYSSDKIHKVRGMDDL